MDIDDHDPGFVAGTWPGNPEATSGGFPVWGRGT